MQLRFEQPLDTRRLTLRPLVPTDAAALLAYRSLPEACRYVPFEPMDEAEIARRLHGPWARRVIAEEGEGLLIGVARRDSGELVGDISLFLSSVEHGNGEIGWLLDPRHSGHGYATEAARGVMGLAYERLGVRRVVARVDARNERSLRLCERLGMRREAHLVENEWFKGRWSDEIDFALLAREWTALQDPGSGQGEGEGTIGGRSA